MKRTKTATTSTEKHTDTVQSVIASEKIFAPLAENNTWYVDREKLSSDFSLHIPLVIDTEFTSGSIGELKQTQRIHLTTQIKGIGADSPYKIYVSSDSEIANQINSARLEKNLGVFPQIESIFHPIHYLRDCGLEVGLRVATKTECKKLKRCVISLIGHFLTAELNLICSGSVKAKFKELQAAEGNQPKIEMGRRVRCVTPGKKGKNQSELDFVDLDHVITIGNADYSLALRLIDTGAIHGVASYGDFCKAVGWHLKFKDNFTRDEKGRMLDMAKERPQDFENYALGDLEVYEALNSYQEQFIIVYEKLGLHDEHDCTCQYYRSPKLTIGGTVKDLFEAALAKNLGILTVTIDEETGETEENDWVEELREVVSKFIHPSSADKLRKYTNSTKALLAKVEGGRCRNNRPIDITIKPETLTGKELKSKGLDTSRISNLTDESVFYKSLICDIDISGCYGEGQRNQSYCIGNPVIWEYKSEVSNNKYVSLREWLKANEVPVDKLIEGDYSNWGELVSGNWIARIKTLEKLTYPQDFFASWFTDSGHGVDLMAKFVNQMACDTDLISTEWVDFDEEIGFLKIFNNEIHNGLLQHDGLEWIFQICSKRQRNELLDKVVVLSSSVYPKSQQVEPNLEKLKEIYEKWEGKNITNQSKDAKGRIKVNLEFVECHAWFSINLGELLINDLLIERKKAQKICGKKSPLDVLFKLCVNTLYGDMVSKFFTTSNTVCGNNITARARALAWYMEKGFHGWQSITDGCGFELNAVTYYGRDKVNGETVNLHRSDSQLVRRKIQRKPLANANQILCEWVDYEDKGKSIYTPRLIVDGVEYEGYQAMEWLDIKAMLHLQELFPNVAVLHAHSTAIKVNVKGENVEVNFEDRKGQFSFETKDIYHSASFHGSANYLFINPNGSHIKARGYETKREHLSIENETELLESPRYGKDKNPAKDLMNQILTNPSNIKRQVPAVKMGILKVGDYKNLTDKYDEIGLEPGDSILKVGLMQEFSLSQFTFQTYEQYASWKKQIDFYKLRKKQSLESFFIKPDKTLNFETMVLKVDKMIAKGVLKPISYLDKNNHRQRDIAIDHPHLEDYQKVKKFLNGMEE